MDGTNKFLALGHGFQKAIRTLRFTRLPPVLAFRLPRFVCLNKETKIWTMFSDRLEFPQTIDMEEYLDEKAPQKGTDNQYELFSVIVHSGTGEGTLAEFSAFIKPLANDDKWYTFDSTRVFETTVCEIVITNTTRKKMFSLVQMVVTVMLQSLPSTKITKQKRHVS